METRVSQELLMKLRAAMCEIIAALEDDLDTPLDQSALARRREKVREYGKAEPIRQGR